MTIDQMRRTYTAGGFDVADAVADPAEQFRLWFDAAKDNSPGDWFEANAMTLSTADSEGRVTARIVLLKGFDEDCPIFFTNYESEKGRQLKQNAQASLCFYWPHLERQIRIEGVVEKSSETLSDEYFQSRPRGSQLGAWVSEQSEAVVNRDFLEKRLAELELQYANQSIPRPKHWGGYRIQPVKYEFWQGRNNRLHDRIVYVSRPDLCWQLVRLSP